MVTLARANTVGILSGFGVMAALAGIACVPHCDVVSYLFLPGVGLAALLFPQGIHGNGPLLFIGLAGTVDIFIYSLPFILAFRSRAKRQLVLLLVLGSFFSITALGCNAKPTTVIETKTFNTIPAQTYPPRPTVPPLPFKLFHQTDNSLTLVTAETTTDEQIESLIWQLHDAAHNKSFDKIHLPQKFIDERDPIVFIHIYRGTKCAAEKYAAGNPPCGGSYHAAGDYTLGSFKDPNRDDGVLLHDENHQTELWNPDAP